MAGHENTETILPKNLMGVNVKHLVRIVHVSTVPTVPKANFVLVDEMLRLNIYGRQKE
jgi:hypothetical protein